MQRLADVDVSILMCTLNRAEYLEDALARILAQSAKDRFRCEVVVVDNGSTDHTEQLVRTAAARSSIPIRYLFEPSPGIGKARNRSVKEARGTWLAFIDDDELAAANWLAELMSGAESTGALIVGGSVLLDLPDSVLETLGRETRRSLRERAADRYGDRVSLCPPRAILGTGNLLLHREVISNVGGFDENMHMGGEDADFLIRARSLGYEVWFVPTAVVRHRIPGFRFGRGYFRRDSLQSGALLASLTMRHQGLFKLFLEMIARVGQAGFVTLPLMAKAAVTSDEAEYLDREIKLWRAYGFWKFSLATALPGLASSRHYLRSVDFREGRTQEPANDPPQPPNGPSCR